MAFSPDGNTLASGGGKQLGPGDYSVRLWGVPDGRLIATLDGHLRRVAAVAFSPDGSLLASASWDSTIRLWAVSSRTLKSTLRSLPEALGGNSFGPVAFSPDGRALAGGITKAIQVWDVEREKLLAQLAQDSNGVHRVVSESSLVYSPDGRTLISGGSDDGEIKVWDLTRIGSDGEVVWPQFQRGGLLSSLEAHYGGITAMAISPDGRTVVSSGGQFDRTIRLWRFQQPTPVFPQGKVTTTWGSIKRQ